MAELIHTCYRVLDVERSIVFYESRGMEELRRVPIRDEATNVFMGLPDDGPRLELTYNHGRSEPYEIGTGYGAMFDQAPGVAARTFAPATFVTADGRAGAALAEDLPSVTQSLGLPFIALLIGHCRRISWSALVFGRPKCGVLEKLKTPPSSATIR